MNRVCGGGRGSGWQLHTSSTPYVLLPADARLCSNSIWGRKTIDGRRERDRMWMWWCRGGLVSYKYPQWSPTPYENIPPHNLFAWFPASVSHSLCFSMYWKYTDLTENPELSVPWASTVVSFPSRKGNHERRRSLEVMENATLELSIKHLTTVSINNGMKRVYFLVKVLNAAKPTELYRFFIVLDKDVIRHY